MSTFGGSVGRSFSTWRGDGPGISLPESSPLKALMGWNGILIEDDSIDVIDFVREFAARTKAESCGRCFPCRMASEEMSAILENMCEGKGRNEDLERLRNLASYMRDAARCDIGKTSPVPLLDALTHFEDHFLKAIREGVPRDRGSYTFMVTAPCMQECPARLDIPGYVELIGTDRWKEALDTVRISCCLPGTIGRVCVRPCESKCTRNAVDESVAIKALKRYAADTTIVTNTDELPDVSHHHEGRVAVIGAGPAGLSCAYYLGLRHYRTTLFEALNEPGGMAAVGIPDYRLPRQILRDEAVRVEAVGGEFRYGVKVGADVTLQGLFDEGYEAIFVAAGAPGSSSMGVEGEDAGYIGYMAGVDFLRGVALGEKPLEGKKIVVVGGGNVAMDCVRSARRLGFDDVNLVYRRSEKEMPADQAEVEESKEEGIHYHTLANPVRIIARDGRVTAVECIRMGLGEPDASGRRRPVPIDGSNFVIECDAVVPAIGQACEIGTFALPTMDIARNQTLVVDPITMRSSDPRVFGGGDCFTGPSTLIAALAAGKRAARYIAQYLETGSCEVGAEEHLDVVVSAISTRQDITAPPFAAILPRQSAPVVDPTVRVNDFSEVEGVFSPRQAREEADRCLRCYRIIVGAL
jgi:formate dehydrogenase (NADP+) beta subunit